MSGIFVVKTNNLDTTISMMDKITNEWTDRAARMECSWVCADCCSIFPEGMPDECAHELQWCTNLCIRDKASAALKA